MSFFRKRNSRRKSEKHNCVKNYCLAKEYGCQSCASRSTKDRGCQSCEPCIMVEECCCQNCEPCQPEECGWHPACPCPTPEALVFGAQYGTTSNPPSGTNLPFYLIFNLGDQITLADDFTIVLPAGYLYLISYLFLSTTEAGGYMEIVPFLNETPRLLYSSFAPAGSARNTSASGSFTTNEAAEGELRLQFRLTYPETVRNIDISGAVSVTPLQRL